MKRTPLIFALLFIGILIYAQSALPVVPAEETVRYRRTGSSGTPEYDTQHITRYEEQGVSWYRFTYDSPTDHKETIIRESDLFPVRKDIHVFEGEREYREQIDILSRPSLDVTHLPVIDLGDLSFLIRFYPVEEREDRILYFLNGESNDMGDMAFRVTYAGEETILIDGISYDTWKLELKTEVSGAMGFFAAVIPRTYFWLSKDPSRVLLKFTGPGGLGRKNIFIVEMVSYKTP